MEKKSSLKTENTFLLIFLLLNNFYAHNYVLDTWCHRFRVGSIYLSYNRVTRVESRTGRDLFRSESQSTHTLWEKMDGYLNG